MQVNEEILNSLKNLLITPQRDLGKEIKEKLFVLELGAEQVDYSGYQTHAVGCHGLPYQEWESQRVKYKTEPFKIMVTKIADIDAYEKHIDKWSEEIYRDIIRLDFREIITIFEEIKDFRRILEGANGHIEKAYDKFWNDLVIASQGRKFKTLNTEIQSMNGIESNYEDRSFSLSNFKDWVLPIFGYPAFEPISFKGHQNKRGVNDIGEHQEGHKYFEKPRVSTVSTHFDYLDTDFKIDGEAVFITTLFLENVKDIIRLRIYAITSMLENLEKFSQLHGGFIKSLPPATKKAEVKAKVGRPAGRNKERDLKMWNRYLLHTVKLTHGEAISQLAGEFKGCFKSTDNKSTDNKSTDNENLKRVIGRIIKPFKDNNTPKTDNNS